MQVGVPACLGVWASVFPKSTRPTDGYEKERRSYRGPTAAAVFRSYVLKSGELEVTWHVHVRNSCRRGQYGEISALSLDSVPWCPGEHHIALGGRPCPY